MARGTRFPALGARFFLDKQEAYLHWLPTGMRNFFTGAWVGRPARPPISCVTSGRLLSFSELVSLSVKCLYLRVL